MEDKRTAFAILLIIMVVMVYSEWVFAPYKANPPRPNAPAAPVQQATQGEPVGQQQTSQQYAAQGAAPALTPSAFGEDPTLKQPRHPTPAELRQAPKTVIETEKVIATISHLGARIMSFKLKNYRERLGQDMLYEIVSSAEASVMPLGLYTGGQSDEHTLYSLAAYSEGARKSDDVFYVGAAEKELFLSFSGVLPNGTSVDKIVRFRSDSYLFDVEIKLGRPPADGSSLWLEWAYYLSEQEANDRINPKQYTLLGDNNKIRHITPTEVKSRLSDASDAQWLGFADKYFTATLIPAVRSQNIRVGKEESSFQGQPRSLFMQQVRGGDVSGSFKIYGGPKEYETLRQAGLQLERSIDLGFFSFLAYPLLLLLRAFFGFLNNWGLAVVLLTLVVKGLFFPLTRASLKSMQAMQALQPEMKALRERVKDPTELNQQMLALYKKNNVNPMGGCLPILIQIPVFFGLYSALGNAIELRHARFALWVKDLSAPERLEIAGFNFPVMILIMGATMFIQQYTTPTPGMDATQRKTMLFTSVIFTGMFLVYPFPAGLALYMLVNTFISLVQQIYLKNDKKANPFQATALASVAIFLIAFVLTRIG